MIEILVFGSNLAGRHGAGAALMARRDWGAIECLGVGRAGNSYAIPTKDCQLYTLPKPTIALYIGQFMCHALHHWSYHGNDFKFKVTRVGCGLAGFKDQEIAPLFNLCTPNCYFDYAWKPWLNERHRYWGTFGK